MGDKLERKKALIEFYDQIIFYYLNSTQNLTELESKMMKFIKRLEKAIARYIKMWNFDDKIAANFVNLRTRSTIHYHHYQWQEGKMAFSTFEEILMVFITLLLG